MYHVMYTSPENYKKYQEGKVAMGVSQEGRKFYGYMMMEVSVHASEVIGIETKTMGRTDGYNKTTQFISYDIRRLRGHGD